MSADLWVGLARSGCKGAHIWRRRQVSSWKLCCWLNLVPHYQVLGLCVSQLETHWHGWKDLGRSFSFSRTDRVVSTVLYRLVPSILVKGSRINHAILVRFGEQLVVQSCPCPSMDGLRFILVEMHTRRMNLESLRFSRWRRLYIIWLSIEADSERAGRGRVLGGPWTQDILVVHFCRGNAQKRGHLRWSLCHKCFMLVVVPFLISSHFRGCLDYFSLHSMDNLAYEVLCRLLDKDPLCSLGLRMLIEAAQIFCVVSVR